MSQDMYDLSFHVRWLRLLAVVCFALALPVRGLSLQSITVDSRGQAYAAKDTSSSAMDKVQPSQRATNWVRSTATFFLHNSDGMTFSERIATGTQFGDVQCDGVTHCQFRSFAEARDFCLSNTTCDGILQQTYGAESGCAGGLGCFYPAQGHLHTDLEWRREGGKTYERQVLAYNHFQDGRKLNDVFPVGTRHCIGAHYCQFSELKPALDFCDLDAECLGVLKMPASAYGAGCKGGKGCYSPGKGSIFHDPLWLKNLGETFLKEQEVAYTLRDEDGQVYDGRFPAGTAGCQGVHNCQFKALGEAQAYCDADPTCKGVVRKPAGVGGNQDCTDGLGCFEPCKGKLKHDTMFLVMEGKQYERRIVR